MFRIVLYFSCSRPGINWNFSKELQSLLFKNLTFFKKKERVAQAWTDSQYKSFRTLLYGSFAIHVPCVNSLKKEKRKKSL